MPPFSFTSKSRALLKAVFKPEKDMLQSGLSNSGRGKLKRVGSPSLDFSSTNGPPGYPRPKSFAVLSNSSPGASSIVPPILLNSVAEKTARN